MPAMTQMPGPEGTLPTLMDVLGGKLPANNNQVKYQTLDVDPLVRNAFRCGACRQISIKKLLKGLLNLSIPLLVSGYAKVNQ